MNRGICFLFLIAVCLPFGSHAVVWQWNTAGNIEGWTIGNAVSSLTATGGELVATYNGAGDPFIHSPTPLGLNGSSERWLIADITMSVAGPHDFQIFYRRNGFPGDDWESHSFHWTVDAAAGVKKTYVVNIPAKLAAEGKPADWVWNVIDQLRLDIGGGYAAGQTCKIDYLAIVAGLDWNFNTNGDFESWGNYNPSQINVFNVTGGVLEVGFVNTTAGDPHMGVSPLFFNCDTYKWARIRQNATGHTGDEPLGGECHYFPSTNGSFGGRAWTFYPNVGYSTIILDMQTGYYTAGQWTGLGNVTTFRIDNTTDPLTNWQPNGRVYYDRVALLSNPADSGPYLWDFSGSGPGAWVAPKHAPFGGSNVNLGGGLGTITGAGTLGMGNFDVALDAPSYHYLLMDVNIVTSAARENFEIRPYWIKNGEAFNSGANRKRLYTLPTNAGTKRYIFDLASVSGQPGDHQGAWDGYVHGLLMQCGTGEAGVTSVAFDNLQLIASMPSAPTVTDVAVKNGLTVDVTFSQQMGTGATAAGNYVLSGSGKGSLAANPSSVSLICGHTYRLTWATGEMVQGGNITITVTGVQDIAGNAIGSPNSGTHTGGGIGTAPSVTGVSVQTGLTVDVSFSETMGAGVTTAANYTLSGSGKGSLASNPDSVALVSGNTYRLAWLSGEMKNGGDITITVSNAQDVAGNAIGSPNSGTHTGGGIGTAPTVAGVSVQTGLTVDVSFSEAMGADVTTASNYAISGSGRGTLASNPDSVALVSGNTYRLTWLAGEMKNGGDITITVSNAQDVAGNAIGSPNSGTHAGGGLGVAPSVLNVTSSLANGYYRAGQIVPIQVTFSEPVFVAGGTPTLALNSGGAANYNSGSGGATLTFNYTVSAGQNAPDLDYTGIGALALGSATIRDAAGNDAVTALPSPGAPGSLGANKDLAIDTSPPTATAITSVTPNPTNGTTVTFSVTFNEPVQQFNDTNDLVITKTGSVAHAGVTIAGGPAVYTVSLTGVTGEGTVKLAVRVTSPGDVKDLAGNALWSSVTSADVRIDRTNPSVTVASLITKDPTPTLSGTVSDNVGVAGVTVVVAGHSYAAVVAGGAWTADVTDPLPDGTHDVQATAADTAGNTAVDATADELVIDQTPPVVTVASRMTNDTTPTISGTVSDNRGVSGVTVTVNGQTYPADVAGNAWTAEVTHALAEGVYDVLATATDTVGNIGTDATTDELAIDFNVPSVTVDFLATNDPTPTVTGTAAAQPGHVINSVSVVVNGVAYPYTPAPPSNTVNWSVTTGALLDGTYDVLATATDDVSRTGGDGTVDELVVDTQSPAAVLARAGASETGADAVVFNVTFNEPVSPTFGLGDVTVTGSLSGAVSVGGADPNYTVTVTLDEPDTDGTVGIVVGGDVTDAAGNPYAGGASPLYGIYNWRGFLLEPSSRKAYEGVSHTFEVAPDCGATTIAYLWKWDDGSKTIYDGPAAPVWTFESLNASNAGTYWCELTYDGETHATAQATLAVAAPLTILQQPAGGQAPVGGSFTFTVSARGGYEPLAYQWLKNGYPIGGATQPIYSIGVLATTDSGSYTVSITDDNTAVLVSEAAVLTVTGGAMPAAGLAGLAALALALGGLGVIRRRKE